MDRLLMIGIDSLSPELLLKYKESLPTFSALMDSCPDIKLNSIFPVDSVPAWASIYTGLNPANHGIVKTFDIFDTSLGKGLDLNTNILQGKTFWDYASLGGKKVCILFPLLGYPAWGVNGIMVGRAIEETIVNGGPKWTVQKRISCYPPSTQKKLGLNEFMKGISGKHPGNDNLEKWANYGKDVLLNEANIGLKLYKENKWDLFFIYFSWLDIIQHRLWRFSDEMDPSYVKNNKLVNIIKDFYVSLDEIVHDFVSFSHDQTIMVFSDHGHGMRPTKVININKILKQNNLIMPGKFYLDNLIELVKLGILDIATRFELDYWLINISTMNDSLSSMSKKVYMSSSTLKKKKTIAHLSAFAGVKSYPHGGIEINAESLGNQEYESIRNSIIQMLLNLKDPHSKTNLVKWACNREDLYQGHCITESFPDIVFRLEDNYGVGWNMYTSLISKAYDHNLASGGHKENAVFYLINCKHCPNRKNMDLMDIAPTVLDILTGDSNGIAFDGNSILG